jgi:SAM-dependent methyltransferase
VTLQDPVRRFSSRVADYVRYRPSYPREILPLLESGCGLTAGSMVADIGSGTGLLAKRLLEFGCRVVGVEPNADMRRAGDEFLAGFERFRSLEGRAEDTHLETASVDLVTAGQAFHWFDPAAARAEFRRILREPRWVALIWNERVVPESGFLADYEALLLRLSSDYGAVDHRRIGADALTAFFEHDAWSETPFPNAQTLDWEGVRGRLMSSSYVPLPGTEGYAPMMAEVEAMFAKYQQNGRIEFLYDTNVYYGRL